MTKFGAGPPFTLGVEEEFQIVDAETMGLVSRFDEVLGKAEAGVEENLQSELFQAVVETATEVCRDVGELRDEIHRLRGAVIDYAEAKGYAIAAAGTHPFARYEDQDVTEKDRYQDLVEEMRWAAKRELVFGQHVHVGVRNPEEAIFVQNGLRPFLPLLLALSVNSPFWKGEATGLMSTRVRILDALPRTGIPRAFRDWADFMDTVQKLKDGGSIEDVTRIWWDVRPRHDLGTVEVRIADLPTAPEESLALAALTQALVARLARAHERGEPPPVTHDLEVIQENRWRALRRGLDSEFIQRTGDGGVEAVPLLDALGSTLELLGDVPRDLGLEDEMKLVESMAVNRSSGADRQLEVHEREGSLEDVVADLVARTPP